MAARISVVARATPCTLLAQHLNRPIAMMVGLMLFSICATFQFANNLAFAAAARALFPWLDPQWIVLGLNLLVILLNKGLMPISPETVLALYPDIPLSAWQIGARPGRSKNILLPVEDTRLAWLSDSILLPEWFPWTRALSPGDLLIVLGVFWLLAVEAPKQSGLPEPPPGN